MRRGDPRTSRSAAATTGPHYLSRALQHRTIYLTSHLPSSSEEPPPILRREASDARRSPGDALGGAVPTGGGTDLRAAGEETRRAGHDLARVVCATGGRAAGAPASVKPGGTGKRPHEQEAAGRLSDSPARPGGGGMARTRVVGRSAPGPRSRATGRGPHGEAGSRPVVSTSRESGRAGLDRLSPPRRRTAGSADRGVWAFVGPALEPARRRARASGL